MKRAGLLFAVFFLCFFLPEKSYGLSELYRVSNISPETIQSQPKQVVSVRFLVSNLTSQSQMLLAEVNLPAGWQPLFPISSLLTLDPAAQEVRIFGLMVPGDAAAGRYEISYSLFSQPEKDLLARDSVFVEVESVTQLQLILVDRPKMVIAGEEYYLNYKLVNRGNSEVPVDIETQFEPEAAYSCDFSKIKIKPGGSQDLQIKVKTNSKLTEKMTQSFRVKARTIDASKQEVVEMNEGLVDIFPRTSGEFDPFIRIPGRLKLGALGYNSDWGWQAELSGSGQMNSDARLAYLFRTPGPRTGGVYSSPEHYHLAYYSSLSDLYLGYGGYRLSPLTEESFEGRGLDVTGRLEKFSAGGFYAVNLPRNETRKENGVRLGYNFGPWLNLQANYLKKIKPAIELENGQIWGLQMDSQILKDSRLTGEYAYSRGSPDAGASDKAWQARLSGEFFNNNYSLEKKYAGPKFAGLQRNLDLFSGNFSRAVLENLGVSFYYQKIRDNLDLAPETTIATSEKLYRASLDYSPFIDTSLALGYETFDREDLQVPVDFDFKQENIKLSWNQIWSQVSLEAALEHGRLYDRLLAETFGTSGYNVSAFYSVTPLQRYGVSYKAGQYEFNGSPDWHTTIGASLDWQLQDNLWWDLNYQKNDQSTQQVSSSLKIIVFESHLLEAGFNFYTFSDATNNQISFGISYSIPWSLPVWLRGGFGRLDGKIYDAQKPGHPGLKNVVLKIGPAMAVTNGKGEFSFSGLKAGTNYLMVERGSIGISRTLTRSLPMELKIESNKTEKIEIGVIDSARLTGRVALFEKPAAAMKKVAAGPGGEFVLESGRAVPKGEEEALAASFEEVQGLEDILVEISDGRETVRRVTDYKGRFVFEDIQPGKWQLKISGANLPDLRYLEKDGLFLELQPGEQKELPVFRVLPKKRDIQIIEGGKVK